MNFPGGAGISPALAVPLDREVLSEEKLSTAFSGSGDQNGVGFQLLPWMPASKIGVDTEVLQIELAAIP